MRSNSGSIETNPFSSADPQNRAVAPALSLQICACVNGFCVAAGAEQSEFRLLHSSRYWPTLSLIILANIDTACVVSHLTPPPLLFPSHAEQREREEDGQSRIIRFGKQ